jgi:hypothetical protein
MRTLAATTSHTSFLMTLQDAPFVLDKSTFFKGAKRKRASAAGAYRTCGVQAASASRLHISCSALFIIQQHIALLNAGDAGPPQPGQRPGSAGARLPAAAAAAAPCANEGVLADDDDDDDVNVFGQFQFVGLP